MLVGYMNIFDIDCTYTMNDNYIYVIPKNKNDKSKLWSRVSNGINMLEDYSELGEKHIFFIKNTSLGLNSLIFELDFLIYVIAEYKVNQVIISCNDLDKFVKPSGIYYAKRNRNREELKQDLLYHSDIIREFEFTAFGKLISGKFVIGEILRNGIASDLKLHAKLKLSFEETDDYSFIYYICSIVKKFLQIALYNKDINLTRIELAGNTESHPFSYIGNLHIKSTSSSINELHGTEYLIIQDYIEDYFKLLVEDNELYVKHLPGETQSRFTSDIARYLNIYSAFENEYKKLPKKLRKKDDTPYRQIKQFAINALDSIDTNNEDEKLFIKQSKERVRQIGTQYGERDRIINAFSIFKENLEESITWYFNKESFDITIIANSLSKTRDSIVHNNLDRELTDSEIKNIRLLEWLTYSMLLKRIGLNCDLIQIVLGAVFSCNGKHISFKPELK